MSTLALDTRDLALQIHALLREIDPAAWKGERENAVRHRIDRSRDTVATLLANAPAGADTAPLALSLQQTRAALEQLPAANLPRAQARAAWRSFRAQLASAYADLSIRLEAWDVHVPSLRPTNYARNVLHVCSALAAITVLNLVPAAALVPVAAVFVALAFGMETTRRLSPRVNSFLMWIFGPVAHPHEAHRVNSASWYAVALLILAWAQVPVASLLGLIALGFGDPAAAIIGRAFGRIKLLHGRSLEGCVAFVGITFFIGSLALRLLHPELPPVATLLAPLAAGVVGAIVELLSRRVDDNLSIPLLATGGAALALSALGIAA